MRLLVLLFFCGSVHAQGWETKDTVLLSSALALQAIDIAQTKYAAKRGWREYSEMNPLLGEKPGLGRIDKAGALAMLGTAGLSYALPTKYRRAFLGGVVVIEAAAVINNHSIGMRVDF